MLEEADRLFKQLENLPVDAQDIKAALGKKRINFEDPQAIPLICGKLSSAGLTLRNEENLADALVSFGFTTDVTLQILTHLHEQNLELARLFESMTE